jgi:hypothetical protein
MKTPNIGWGPVLLPLALLVTFVLLAFTTRGRDDAKTPATPVATLMVTPVATPTLVLYCEKTTDVNVYICTP